MHADIFRHDNARQLWRLRPHGRQLVNRGLLADAVGTIRKVVWDSYKGLLVRCRRLDGAASHMYVRRGVGVHHPLARDWALVGIMPRVLGPPSSGAAARQRSQVEEAKADFLEDGLGEGKTGWGTYCQSQKPL